MRKIFVDLEHTGGANPQILDLAVVNEQGEILFNSLIRPPEEIYGDSARMQQWHITAKYCHRILPKDVQDAPLLEDVLQELAGFFDGAVMVAHNTACEMSVLPAALTSTLAGKICTMSLFRQTFPKDRNSLTAALDKFGVKLENAHTALADAIGCFKLFEALEGHRGPAAAPKARRRRAAAQEPVVKATPVVKAGPVIDVRVIMDSNVDLREQVFALKDQLEKDNFVFSQAGQKWGPDQEANLQACIGQGLRLVDICKQIGRSPYSIVAQVIKQLNVQTARQIAGLPAA